MDHHSWMPPTDVFHGKNFPYHPGRKLMITPHTPPDPFHGPHYHRLSEPARDFDMQAAIAQRKTRSQLVLESLPRGTIWPTNDGTKSSQHIGLTIEDMISTTQEGGSQLVLCKLNPGQKVKGIPPRVVAKIYDPLYYVFMRDHLRQPTDVVNQADIDLSRDAAVYQHFKAQGKDGEFAPRFYGTYTTPIRSNIENKYRPVCLILMEYIDGFTMDSLCTVPFRGGPALVPEPLAGNDEQRMLVMKEVLDLESRIPHAGVAYGHAVPENILISRPFSDKTNPASKPRVVFLGWRFADVKCKTVDIKPMSERLPFPVNPMDWNTARHVAHFEGWIPSEYFQDKKKFEDWLTHNFGGENLQKYCRMSELDQFDSSDEDSDDSDAPTDDENMRKDLKTPMTQTVLAEQESPKDKKARKASIQEGESCEVQIPTE